VKWFKGAKLEETEDVLVIWIWQANAKNETESDEVIRN
jgi:hypothetical protein